MKKIESNYKKETGKKVSERFKDQRKNFMFPTTHYILIQEKFLKE
jgi:hypothetical protein